MKICATCEKPLEDQAEKCSRCGMNAGPYSLSSSPQEYRHHPRWTLFPPIPKTQWWGTELKLGRAGRPGTLGSVVSNGADVIASGPDELDLDIGCYEFHCLLTVENLPGREEVIGRIRVLGNVTNSLVYVKSKAWILKNQLKKLLFLLSFNWIILVKIFGSSFGVLTRVIELASVLRRFGWCRVLDGDGNVGILNCKRLKV